MGINIDNILATNSVEIQRRIMRYDVNWGRPLNALYYKRLILSMVPAYYWKMESATSVNIGYLRSGFNLAQSGSGATFTTGVVDGTDNATNLTGNSYFTPSSGQAIVEFANGLAISAWIYCDTSTVSADKGIVCVGPHSSSASHTCTLGIELSGGNVIPYAQFQSGVKLEASGAMAVVNTLSWNHVCITVEPLNSTWTATLYLNGLQVAQNSSTGYAPNLTDTTPVVVGAARTSSSAVDTSTRFTGSIDEVSVHPRSITPEWVANIYVVGFNSTYIEPDEVFDTDSLGTSTTAQTWVQVVNDLAPLHWWTLDATTHSGSDWLLADTPISNPSAGVSLKCFGVWDTNNTHYNSLISAKNYASGGGGAKTFSGFTSYAAAITDLNYSKTPGHTTDFTVAFWYQPLAASSDRDGVMGYNSTGGAIWGNPWGFGVSVQNGNLIFTFGSPTTSSNSGSGPFTQESIDLGTIAENKVVAGQSYFIVCTLSTSGAATTYVNGSKVNAKQLNYARGMYIPPDPGNTFRLGCPTGFSNPPRFYLDEVMIFEKVLTLNQVSTLYKTGIFGPTYTTTLSGGDPESEGSPYILGSNEYSELVNSEDISAFVQDYRVDTDVKQVVETAVLSVYESWGMLNIKNSLRANTYITLEERYVNTDSNLDSGWQPKGHFLVEGPMGRSTTPDGNRVYHVALKGLLKVLSFDLAHRVLQPDILKVSKRTFDVVTTFTDYTQYQFSNPLVPGAVYDNWTVYPAPQVWATNFLNLGSSLDGGVSTSTDVIRIKGSQGGVTVQGGNGAIIINNNYLAAAIAQNGLSNPQTVMGQVYRYASINDVESNITINSITFTDRWYVSFNAVSDVLDNKTLWMKSGAANGKYYTIQDFGSSNYHLIDANGLSISPLDEGIAEGDTIQLGDYNSVEDAIRKVLTKNGFQEFDSSLPFYFQLEPCPNQLAPSAPPLMYKVSDGTRWLQVIADILTYAPPDYRVYTDSNGVIRGQLVGLSALAPPSHSLAGVLDMNEDTTDYGITTRLICEGQGGQSVNVALALGFTGSAAVHAYQLTDYANNYLDLTGRTLSQSDANDLLTLAFSNNPQAVVPPGIGWDYGFPSENRHYGVLFEAFGTPAQVKRWQFEDLDICAVDIGRSANGSAILVDSLQLMWFDHFIEGNRIAQSMLIYYMTEADYEREMSRAAPSTPSATDTTYFPPADSRCWELLVDEFSLQNGVNAIPFSEFIVQRPTSMRFVKFVCGQCQFRLQMQTGQYNTDVVARVGLADVQIYNSLIIQATGEIGVTPGFNSGDYKALATRVRRRSDYISNLVFLNTYDTVSEYAQTQLQERYIDFTPVTTTVFNPTVDTGEVVTLKDPESQTSRNYLVTACTHMSDGTSILQLLNYDLTI